MGTDLSYYICVNIYKYIYALALSRKALRKFVEKLSIINNIVYRAKGKKASAKNLSTIISQTTMIELQI